MCTRKPGGGNAAKRLLRRALMKPAPLHDQIASEAHVCIEASGELIVECSEGGLSQPPPALILISQPWMKGLREDSFDL